MKAMVLEKMSDLTDNREPLVWMDWPDPEPGNGELLIKVSTCGVCHTELDEIEGRTPPPRFPIILGHQAVGRVAGFGAGTIRFKINDRVGVAWIYSACGACSFCLSGNENLCPQFKATGRDAHGGYAEYLTVPERLQAAIDTTPAWRPVVEALKNLKPGGRLVVNAIRKEEADKDALLKLDYSRHLWLEKEIKSVANVARKDVEEFLALAASIPLRPEVQEYKLAEANTALLELKERKIRGAKVLVIPGE